MKYLFLSFLFFFLSCKNVTQYNYPTILNKEKTETHFGINYVDSFNNLENIKDPEVLGWYHKQDSLTEGFFKKNKDYLSLYEDFVKFENRDSGSEKSIKYNEAGFTFFIKDNEHGKGIIYKLGANNYGKPVFDSSNYKDGEFTIEYYKPSYDGKYLAIAMGREGDFFDELIILNTNNGERVGHMISNVKPNKAGGFVWQADSNCILYIKYPNEASNNSDRNSFTEVTCIDNKILKTKTIFKNGINGISLNEEYYPIPKVRSKESNYIFIYEGNAADHWNCYFLPTGEFLKGSTSWELLYKPEDKVFYDSGIEQNHKYYFKRVKSGNTELCLVDLRNPDFKEPKVLVSGEGEIQIGSFKVLKNKILYTLVSNGINEELFELSDGGGSKQIELPFKAGEISFGYRSPYHQDVWVKLSGWVSKPKEYYLNSNNEFEFVELGKRPEYPEFNNLISEVVYVESYDGEKVPLSIIRRKDHKLDGKSMGIITAYGAYGLSETPWFHFPIAHFVNQGNIYATAHVRGGGEKGPKWHDSGKKSTKMNSWKDLIACSEYLIDKKYIHNLKLGLNVNSAGGITGGMAVNERPDLFGVFTGMVPDLNVIRTEYLEDFDDSDTVFEFGTIKEEQSFKELLMMDPLVNFSKDKEYPSTLLKIGFKDYFIPPSGPAKYIAQLQSLKSNGNPYLLDIDFEAEHEIDWTEDYARMLFFTSKELANRN